MKKSALVVQMTAAVVFYAAASSASGGDRGHGHHKHHGHHGYNDYPQGNYYGPPPQQYYRDPRSHQGLAGGVVGSVLGYEIGNGNPVAAGLGAAAGSYLGNEVAGRR